MLCLSIPALHEHKTNLKGKKNSKDENSNNGSHRIDVDAFLDSVGESVCPPPIGRKTITGVERRGFTDDQDTGETIHSQQTTTTTSVHG